MLQTVEAAEPRGKPPSVSIKNLSWFKCDGYWYFATPYSKYPAGMEQAFRDACRAAAKLIAAGVHVYSPIAHTHPIALFGGMDPLDHSIWLPADRPMMDAAHGLIVAKLDGWAESYGVAHEMDVFFRAGKPMVFVEKEEMLS